MQDGWDLVPRMATPLRSSCHWSEEQKLRAPLAKITEQTSTIGKRSWMSMKRQTSGLKISLTPALTGKVFSQTLHV